MFLHVLLSDFQVSLEILYLFINLERKVLLLYTELFIDLFEALVDRLYLLGQLLLLEPEFLQPTVELLLLFMQVLIVQEKMLFLSADVEPLILGHCEIRG